MELRLREIGGAVELAVAARPRAARDEVVGVHGDALKVSVRAAPVDGGANQALVAVLARFFGVPRSAVQVTGGAASRAKRVRVGGLSAAAARARIAELLHGGRT